MLWAAIVSAAAAKTDKFGTWIELELTKKFLKDFEFSFIPEFRLEDNFSLDEYILEGKLGYEPFKFLDFGLSYRMYNNIKDKGNEISHKFVFDASVEQDFGRFEASLRSRFSNDTDSGEIPWDTYYFRPRLKVKYNIRKTKLEPYISYELFRNLKLKNTYKARFDIGASHDIGDYHEVGLYYRLQDYFDLRNSMHILGINYQFKF